MHESLSLLRRWRWLLIAVMACEAGFVEALHANPVAPDPIASVVELFTSQGCPSCPPADRLLTALASEPDVVAVTFPIDYWDFIGWKDTLASPAFTARQKAYAAARGGHVYTPQAVIDGLVDAVGSDKAQIEGVMRATKGKDGALTVPMNLAEKRGVLHVDIGAGPEAVAGVYVLRIVRSKTVLVRRGENSGRSITYTNVVRAIHKIGEWNGKPRSYELRELKGDDEGYVVLLQKGADSRPGAILAAAKSVGF